MNHWITALVVVSVVSLVGAAAFLPRLLTRLPREFLVDPECRSRPVNPLLNVVGVVLILAGVAMLVLPGQGILTIIAGLALTNLEVKDRLMRKLLSQRRVLRAVNAMRSRGGAPPLDHP